MRAKAGLGLTLASLAICCLGLVGGSGNVFLKGAVLPRAVLNIAHAGAASIAPQNTIIAGEKALAAGADLWGIDVRLTKDGVFVLMHDGTLERTTNVEEVFPDRSPWEVKDFTLNELRTLDAGSWFLEEDPFGQIEEGNVTAEDQASYVGERIPTLREALLFTVEVDWRIDIEVKPMDYASPEEIAEKLVSLLEETGAISRAMVSSFDHDILREVKRLDPAIPTAALVILPLVDPIGYLEGLGVDAYEPSPVAFIPKTAERLKRLGYGVYVWTYNDPDQLERLAGTAGVSGIYTDFPQRLEPILDRLFGPDGD